MKDRPRGSKMLMLHDLQAGKCYRDMKRKADDSGLASHVHDS